MLKGAAQYTKPLSAKSRRALTIKISVPSLCSLIFLNFFNFCSLLLILESHNMLQK